MISTSQQSSTKRTTKVCLAAAALLALSACGGGGGGDDDSSEGTNTPTAPTTPVANNPTASGVSLRGTTSSERQLATTQITARAQSGEITTTTLNDQGQFSFDELLGTGPWILRADLGNDSFMYSIAADLELSAIVQNIHSYTDAIARNWYATQGSVSYTHLTLPTTPYV